MSYTYARSTCTSYLLSYCSPLSGGPALRPSRERPSVRATRSGSCCTLPAAPRCSYMYGEKVSWRAAHSAWVSCVSPVLTAVSPSIVPAALRKSTMSFAPTPRTHVSNSKWNLKWKRFRIPFGVSAVIQNINGKSEIQVHSTPLGRGAFERGAYPPPNTLRYNLRETGLSA